MFISIIIKKYHCRCSKVPQTFQVENCIWHLHSIWIEYSEMIYFAWMTKNFENQNKINKHEVFIYNSNFYFCLQIIGVILKDYKIIWYHILSNKTYILHPTFPCWPITFLFEIKKLWENCGCCPKIWWKSTRQKFGFVLVVIL